MTFGSWKLFILFGIVSSVCFAIPDMESYMNMESEEESSKEGVSEGKKSTNCSCGYTNKARIVGGKETLVNEFPLMAGFSIRKYAVILCGGTIITPYHVVTAAHCTDPYKNEQIDIVVGEHNQFKEGESKATQTIPVEKVFQHEGYIKKLLKDDISLLVLSKKIDFTQTVGPACLPTKHIDLVNEQVKILGWGRLSETELFSSVLMKVNMRVIPIEHCKKTFPTKYVPVDKPTQVCVIANKKDSCQGDSGGPVIWLDPDINRYTIVGLVSFGRKSCASQQPAVNTEIAAYLDWIQDKIAASKPDVQTCAKI